MSGWQLLGFESFEDYGLQRFGFEKAHLHRLAIAHEMQISLSPMGDKDIPERQLRPLSQIPAEERQAILSHPVFGNGNARYRFLKRI
jgi:hypothetical protein